MEADLFWHRQAFARVLRAYVRRRRDPGFGAILALGDLHCLRTVLKTVDGEQHLLLHDRRRVIQLLCRGADLRTDPFALELVVDGFPEIEGRLRLLKAMADVCREHRIGGGSGAWSVKAIRHRDALAALDRRTAGWSYREIAVYLHGEEAVRRDWTNPDQTLKNRVIRSVKRGLRLRDGGYRTLLE